MNSTGLRRQIAWSGTWCALAAIFGSLTASGYTYSDFREYVLVAATLGLLIGPIVSRLLRLARIVVGVGALGMGSSWAYNCTFAYAFEVQACGKFLILVSAVTSIFGFEAYQERLLMRCIVRSLTAWLVAVMIVGFSIGGLVELALIRTTVDVYDDIQLHGEKWGIQCSSAIMREFGSSGFGVGLRIEI